MADQINQKSVERVPAPWELEGEAWLLLLKPGELSQSGPQIASRLWPGVAMYVNYTSSPVGPYEELLLIPGRMDLPHAQRLTISTIYVSTWESVVNGRENWGIPKQLARFDRKSLSSRRESLQVFHQDQLICSWELSHKSWHIPFGTKLIPKPWKTIAQVYAGQGFEIVPEAAGKMSFGKLHAAWGDPRYWMEGDHKQSLLCCKYDKFRMKFPVPKRFAVTPELAERVARTSHVESFLS